ncbi:MAG: AAA family ATPase [Campylobacterales bacterium]|nr:AAA family ATPase [Campylobacterales bacterium]
MNRFFATLFTMKATQEQQEILESIKQHKSIKINAFAGTGKTTTLKLIAQKYANHKILYLAFNTSIKDEAAKLFAKNIFVKTTHGLAYAAIKKHTNLNIDKLRNYRVIDISKEFQVSYNQAIGALKIFENFCNNAKEQISTKDTEHTIAKQIWDYMLLGKIAPNHSFYLKYYYLLLKNDSIPQFGYDIVMLDEAQDTNEVTLGIFENLKTKIKIFVGDTHQQIYSFRGSKNALDKIECDKTLYLSQTFRFNETIANYANTLLENFKNEKIKIKSTQAITNPITSHGFISRTNATLITQIAQRIEQKKPFVTVRDPNEIFNLTQEVVFFINQEDSKITRNKFLKDFDTIEDLNFYAKEVEDYELLGAIKVANEFGTKIFDFEQIATKFYKAWQNRINNGLDQRLNEIVFLTTAHTAKGLEWDSVEIADDFPEFSDILIDLHCETLQEYQNGFKTLSHQELIDEFNLFYVAITRAKQRIIKTSINFHYLGAKNIAKLIDQRIEETKKDIQNMKVTSSKHTKITKLSTEDKNLLRQERNIQEGKAQNSGMKWTLEDRIKAKSMFRKNNPIEQIAQKLARSNSAILAELFKSEVITKDEQIKLASLDKKNPKLACLKNL